MSFFSVLISTFVFSLVLGVWLVLVGGVVEGEWHWGEEWMDLPIRETTAWM